MIYILLILNTIYYLYSLYSYFGAAVFLSDGKEGMFFKRFFSDFSKEGYGFYSFLYWMFCYIKTVPVLIYIWLIAVWMILHKKEKDQKIKKEKEYKDKLIKALESANYSEDNDRIIQGIGQIKQEAQKKELAYIQNNLKIKEEYENLAHQMKSALNALTLETEILLAKNGISYESIEERAEHLNELCEKMMNLKTSIISKNHYLNMQRIDVSALIYRVLKQLEPECIKKNIALKCSIQTAYLTADAFWLKEAVETLVKNAVYFSPKNSLIEIELYKAIHSIRLRIKNKVDLDGNKKENCKDNTIEGVLFNRYAKSQKDNGGRGIGLHMAQSVFSYHFGKLNYKWEKGTSFKIEGEIPVSVYEE